MSTRIETTSRPYSAHIYVAECDLVGWPSWRLRLLQLGLEFVRVAIAGSKAEDEAA